MSRLQQLRTLIARRAGAAPRSTVLTHIPGLIVAAAASPSQPVHSIFEPAFVLVAQGTKKLMLGDRAFTYGAGEYLVVSVDLPTSGRIETATPGKPLLAVGVTLNPAAIATLLLETAGHMATFDESHVPGLAVSKAPRELLDTVLRPVGLLDRPKDALVLLPAVERELLWWLLNGPQGAMVRQIGLTDSRLSRIGHAIRWIRSNYAMTLRVEDLSDMARMSPSTFHRHFRAITTMTPVQYQKQVRLQEARLRLMSQQGDVASVGFAVGYNSPSQFSRDYRRLYGAPPGQDADRLRGAPARLEPTRP